MHPPQPKVLFYGGLVLLAAFEVLEWPVAAAVAAGTAVAQRGQRPSAPDWSALRSREEIAPTPA
jgi:hypothetical protein